MKKSKYNIQVCWYVHSDQSSKGGNFTSPMMHRFILYYQASERTWSYQFKRDRKRQLNNIGKRRVSPVKPCAFAVLIFLRFSFWPSILINLPSDHKAVYAASLPEATTSCKSTWDTVPYFGINGLSMILCLWSPLHPLSNLLAIQDHTQNLEEQLWMGGRREVSIISHRPVTRSDLQRESRLFFRGSVSTFLLLVVWVPLSRGARLLNGVKCGALLEPKEVVIKNSISFS